MENLLSTEPSIHPVSIILKCLLDTIVILGQKLKLTTKKGEPLGSINGINLKVSIDEFRANDYFLLKKNLVPEATKVLVDDIKRVNLAKRNQSKI